MTRTVFGESGCERTLQYLDDYISNELLVTTNRGMLRHLNGCRTCSAELDARIRLRVLIKDAVQSQAIPRELERSIRRSLAHSVGDPWL